MRSSKWQQSGLLMKYHMPSFAYTDFLNDDYHYYRGDDFDNSQLNTIQRYKKFNGTQGNSPTESQYKNQNSGHYPTTATTIPNIEDVNKDNTMSESETYYQYHIKIKLSEEYQNEECSICLQHIFCKDFSQLQIQN